MKKRLVSLFLLFLCMIPIVKIHADGEPQSFEQLSYTYVYNPTTIDRLLESTANQSFKHDQQVLGSWELEYFKVTIPELGWFGFNTLYYSDTDAAGGVRSTSWWVYEDAELTKCIGQANGKILLNEGTYYIVAGFYGSYGYYGYFFPCSSVIKNAKMVITNWSTSGKKAYISAKVPESTSNRGFWVGLGKPANGLDFNNFSYAECYEEKGMEYDGDFYGVNVSLSSNKYRYPSDTSVYYLYLYYPYTWTSSSVADEWRTWLFCVPIEFKEYDTGEKESLEGRIVESGIGLYALHGENATFIGVSVAKESVKSLTIPSYVTYKDKKYKVTVINYSACYGLSQLKKLTIGKYVEAIGSSAFNHCDNLKSINIKTKKLTKRSIGSYAFGNTYENVKVTCPSKKLKDTYKTILEAASISDKATYKVKK